MAKGDKKNIILERRKPKTPQKENPGIPDGRDMFQTPNYATKLLLPFILPPDKHHHQRTQIWECACGNGKIVNVLQGHGYTVLSTDLFIGRTKMDFLTGIMSFPYDMIITNPPFSLKKKFYERCRYLNVPFALLIPADYSGWIIKATQEGCEKIIPTRRIDYITPTGLSGASGHTSYYHSMWLTYGLGLGKTETFVELTNEMKKDI